MLSQKAVGMLILLFGTFSSQASELKVPLHEKAGWEILTYSKILPNRVKFDNQHMVVQVNRSNSPIVLPLSEPLFVKKLSVELNLKQSVGLPKKMAQGDRGADDFSFRIGLVVEGEKTLNFIQRSLAPNWVKKLFSLAEGKAKGIDSIYFFNLVKSQTLLGKKRVHPLSDLIHEEYSWAEDSSKPNYQLIKGPISLPGKVIALWISIDGDDTQSSFEATLKNIVLN